MDLQWNKLDYCNILVTGATGLVGSSIIDLLMKHSVKNCHIYASGRNESRAKAKFSKYYDKENFHFFRYDVEKPLESEIKFDYIIHAASNASPNFFATNPVGVIMSNIIGTKNLLDYGREHGMKRFLYISSGEVYGNGDVEKWHETDSGYVDCMTMRSCYPTSKRAAETLCVTYANQYGIEIVVARLCHTYGPNFTEQDNRAYAQFFLKAIHGEDIVMKSAGEQYRSWIYAEDCANAILTILLNGQNCEAYNVADEKSCVTIREFAEKIANLCNVKVVFDLPSDEERKGFSIIKKATFDTSKLRQLGWKVMNSLDEGLVKTYDKLLQV